GDGFFLDFLTNDIVTEFDTFIADKNRGAGNQLAHFMLTFTTERTVKQSIVFAAFALFAVTHNLTPVKLIDYGDYASAEDLSSAVFLAIPVNVFRSVRTSSINPYSFASSELINLSRSVS